LKAKKNKNPSDKLKLMMQEVSKESTRRITVDLPESVYKKLKYKSVERRRSMKSIILDLLEEGVS
jgi:hypothetical protein